MKKLIIYSILIIFPILIFSGCQFARQVGVEKPVVNRPTVNLNNQISGNIEEKNNLKQCINDNLGLKIKYPQNWQKCIAVEDEFMFIINDSEKISLIFNEENKWDYSIQKNIEEGIIDIISIRDTEIFRIGGYANVLEYIGLIINQKKYIIEFDIYVNLNKNMTEDKNIGRYEELLKMVWEIAKTIESK